MQRGACARAGATALVMFLCACVSVVAQETACAFLCVGRLLHRGDYKMACTQQTHRLACLLPTR
jgi:hypothetical protein